MDIDEMWNEFQKSRSIKKTSIAEKLDTIAAQLNEIQTDSARTAELVPKLLGDDAAIETSNAEMPMDPSMGGMEGAPPMGDAVPGAEDMSPGGMDLGTGDEMTEDTEMPPMEEELPEEPIDEAEMPLDEGLGEPGMDEGVPEEDLPVDEMGEEPLDEGIPEPMGEEMGGGNGSVDALMNMLHEKVDEGDMEAVKALAEAIEALEGTDMEMEEDIGEDDLDIPSDDYDLEGEEMVEDEPLGFVGKSEAAIDPPAVSAAQPAAQGGPSTPITESADDSAESQTEKVMDILSEAQAEVAEVMTGTESPEEGDAEVEIEIEAEPEAEEGEPEPEAHAEEEAESEESEDESPEAELSEEGEMPFKECDQTTQTKKSVKELSFKEIFEARQRGEDLLTGYIQKSAGETNGYNEFDPWGLTRRTEMFKKNETVMDEVKQPQDEMSSDGTDSNTIADDVKAPSDHTEGTPAPATGQLDDVDEEKSENENSVKDGDILDDVEEKKGTSDHEVNDEDLLDDIDEEKSSSENSSEGKDLLDDVEGVHKTAADTGVQIMSIKDMMAIKKTGGSKVSRPDNIATFNGEMERPSLGKLQKSSTPEPVRMGRGVDPHKVVESDWAEYNLYKAQLGL